jgi:polysaccharide export outer membrane protein
VPKYLVLLVAVLMSGCSSLPGDGPSAKKLAEPAALSAGRYTIVDIDYRVTQQLAAVLPAPFADLTPVASDAPIDRIEEGDVLTVSVFQAGFGPTSTSAKSGNVGDGEQTYPKLVVDHAGSVSLPFAGPVQIAGQSPSGAAQAIQKALRGRAVDPQVLVTLVSSAANSVIILGEVRNAGHVALTANSDRLLDVLAAAGGPTKPPSDVMISITRGDRTVSAPLAVVMGDSRQNVRLAPRDQIKFLYRPRRYSSFGALVRDAQTPIEDDSLSLAGALSRQGGLDGASANAASVLLFRFERPEAARALGVAVDPAAQAVPIVYRLNLKEPAGYFVAQKFEVVADDLIYAPHADSVEMRKFFDLVSQISQVGYNISVARLIR